jgi:hypothetical protein
MYPQVGGLAGMTLHYDFATTPSLEAAVGPTLDITRATTAMMKDADGWLREVQSGEARFDGAVFSHNLMTYGDDFDDASWLENGLTSRSVIAGDSPVSGQTVTQLVENAVNTTHLLYKDVTTTVGAAYCWSVYAKQGTGSTRTVAILNNDTITGAEFSLADGSVVALSNSPLDYGSEDVGDGWYRFWVVDTAVTTSDNYRIYIGTGVGSPYAPWTGDGSSNILISASQLEDVSGAWDSENLLFQSNDLSEWSSSSVNVTITGGVTDPDGGTSAYTLTADANDGRLISSNVVADPDDSMVSSIWVKRRTGTGTVRILQRSGALDSDLSPTSEWVRYSNIGDTSIADRAFQLWLGTSGDEVDIWHPQLERTKPSQTGPGTYVATTTAAVTNYSPATYIPTTTAAVTSLSGANDGLLVEEARTNICLQSENLSASWVNFQSVDAQAQSIAPDGSNTANKLTDDEGTGIGQSVIQQNFSAFSVSTTYTWSAFLKADQLSWARLDLQGMASQSLVAYYDLDNGAVGTVLGADNVDQGIEDYGNGWYRCWLTFTTDGTDTSGACGIFICDGDGDSNVARDGTSSIFIWGAQMEAGAFPTSYIPTTTGSVTRNDDSISTTDVSWLTQGVGTMYAEAGAGETAGGTGDLVNMSDGTPADRLLLTRDSGNNARFYCIDGFATQANIVKADAHPGTVKYAAAYSANDFAAYFDGTAGTPDSSGIVSSDISKVNVGSRENGTSEVWNGHIKEVAYWDGRLPDETLDDLSTNGL